jgi:peptide/nickel transport system substrate-binding protein
VVLVAVLLPVAGAGSAATQQTPKRGGTLVLARPAATEPACLNVFACAGNPDAIWASITQVLEGAFEIGPDLVIRDNLVSRVDVNRKARTLTYFIRSEAQWSDGVPVSSGDFWFTQRAFSRVSMPGDPNGEERALYRQVRSSRMLGQKTFRVTLRRPIANWRALYRVVLPRHVLEGKDLARVWREGVDDPDTGHPIGSGPFLVEEWVRGEQITLVRNRRYWGPHRAYLDRLVLRFLEQSQSDPLAPVREDAFHVSLVLGGAFISADIARQVRQAPGWRVEAWPTSAYEHLVFRVGPNGHRALKDRRIRQALAFGVDRVAIANTILQEAPPSARRVMDSMTFLPTDPNYQAAWSGYRYDVDRARRLLVQAGCRRLDGTYVCSGEPLRFRFVTTAGDETRATIARLVQSQLRRVGIQVEPTFVPPRPAFFDQLLPNGDFDIALFSWLGLGGSVPAEARCKGNYAGGLCDKVADRDARLADAIVDPERRARVLHRLDARLAETVPVLPLVQPVFRGVFKDSVRGVYPGGTQFEFSQNSEDWWLAAPR